MGRERFPEIVNKIEQMMTFSYREPHKLNIYGTIGYGKSHILAALACLFTTRGHAVVYIADAETLVKDFPANMRHAFLFACAHPSLRHYWPDIMRIQSAHDVTAFSGRMEEGFIFIIDQYNALDHVEGTGTEKQRQVAKYLAELEESNREHFFIESASANSRSYGRIKRHRNEATIFLFDGMSKVRQSSSMLNA